MKTRVIVLAAGHGKRMNSNTPKVLTEINGEALILHLLKSVKESGVDDRPVIIVGQHADEVKNALGEGYEYIFQKEQLGTAHAVLCAKDNLSGKTDGIIVLYGDQPFMKPETIKKLKEMHEENNSPISMMTTSVENFDGWRSAFYSFGRILRDSNGRIVGIVEKNEATGDELEIKEVNPGYYCFNSGWLWENLEKIKNDNDANEYYLTDLVQIAIDDGEEISSVSIDPKETIGINTPEDFKLVRKLLE